MGYVPTTFPLTPNAPIESPETAKRYFEQTAAARKDAEDAIMVACLKQSQYENQRRAETPEYHTGDKVLLSTDILNLKARGETGSASKWTH